LTCVDGVARRLRNIAQSTKMRSVCLNLLCLSTITAFSRSSLKPFSGLQKFVHLNSVSVIGQMFRIVWVGEMCSYSCIASVAGGLCFCRNLRATFKNLSLRIFVTLSLFFPDVLNYFCMKLILKNIGY